MSWKETDAMQQRQLFIAEYRSDVYSVRELAERYGISRKTAYKWITRFEAEGAPGLIERSRTPHHCPHRLTVEHQELVLGLRREHPHWGAVKLRAVIARRYPHMQLPAASTIGALLKQHGLVHSRPRRRKLVSTACSDRLVAKQPNAVWCIDFKGEFRLGNRRYCYPLTVTDAHSRFVLECHGLAGTTDKGTQQRMTLLFERYGLPEAIRSDNGVPFASRAPLGLSRLSLWWAKLGIQHQRIQPGNPQQNGQHERMHRTLKAETTRPPAENFARQQERFDAWREEFNCERPHQGIDLACPADRYHRSARLLPKQLAAPEYPSHCEQRLVGHNGTIRFKGRRVFLSFVVSHERIALEEVEDGIWDVLLYNLVLGRIDERDYQFH